MCQIGYFHKKIRSQIAGGAKHTQVRGDSERGRESESRRFNEVMRLGEAQRQEDIGGSLREGKGERGSLREGERERGRERGRASERERGRVEGS